LFSSLVELEGVEEDYWCKKSMTTERKPQEQS